ncbi:MAG: MMPL family transporter [Nocardioides sp.]
MNSVQIDGRPGSHAATHSGKHVEHGRFLLLGRFVARRPRTIIAAFVLFLGLAGYLGGQVFPELQAAGYDDPTSDSEAARQFIEDEFNLSSPALVLTLETENGVTDPAAEQAALTLEAELVKLDAVTAAASYWSAGKPDQLASKDGSIGQLLVYADKTSPEEQMELARDVREEFEGDQGPLTVQVGGFGAVSEAVTRHVETDLKKAESIAIPLTILLLIIVFGSVVSAMLPFSVAAGGILGSLAVLWSIALRTDVSIFAINLITGLGLGLGIDYALLIVNRFREELAHGVEPAEAVARTVATAGRTVAVSGLTVAVVLASLLLFPLYFLKSFGYAGIAVTLLAVLASITALPALLAVLGHRVDKLKVRRGDLAPKDTGVWSRVARFVMRYPVPVLVTTTVALGALAAPFLSVEFTQTDARVLPADDPAAAATATLADEFSGQESTPISVVLPEAADAVDDIAAYATALSGMDDIVRVEAPTGVYAAGSRVADNPQAGTFTSGSDARLSVISDLPALSSSARDQIDAIRALDQGFDEVLVGGTAASFTDAQAALLTQGKWALAWVSVATLIIMFLYTGSVLLPIKAVALNALSLAAMMGLLVLVFQEGHLGWLVGDFTVTGGIDTSMAILVAIVTFALSMDYEVFLLSRIKEEHDAGHDNTESVALGLQHSGRIITAAALLLAVVFAAFVSSGVTSIKQLGLGVAFAILLDATVIRGLLVPALMRLLGDWNWWAPRPLRAVHARFGLSD